jgi:transposase
VRNKYINHSHISEAKFRKILKCFTLDITATHTAELVLVDRKTVNRIFNKIREHIAALSDPEGDDEGDFEIDESYFGAKRVRGKSARRFNHPLRWLACLSRPYTQWL